jgi:hypothetical protein
MACGFGEPLEVEARCGAPTDHIVRSYIGSCRFVMNTETS